MVTNESDLDERNVQNQFICRSRCLSLDLTQGARIGFFGWVVIVAPWSIFGFVIFYFTLLARYVRSGTAKPKHATQVVLSVGLCRLYSRLCGQIIVLSRVFLSLFRQ